MKLIVGLGNPGEEYEDTYHNVGAMALDAFGDLEWKNEGDFLYGKLGGIVFMKPATFFMNDSGIAVREGAKKFEISPDHIIVIHDDSDLPIGEHKYSFGGGSAGHKGVQSIIDHLHTNEFGRMRIGIRDPDEKARKKAGDFVLKPVSKKNKKTLEGVFAEIAEKIQAI